MDIKEFFKKKGISFYLIAAAFAFLAAAMITYAAAGITVFTTKLSATVIALLVIGMAAAAVSLWKEFQALSFGVYLLSFLAFFEYVVSELNYLGSIFAGIDGTQFTASFICIVAFSILAWVCALVSAIFFSIKKGRRSGVEAAETAVSAR